MHYPFFKRKVCVRHRSKDQSEVTVGTMKDTLTREAIPTASLGSGLCRNVSFQGRLFSTLLHLATLILNIPTLLNLLYGFP